MGGAEPEGMAVARIMEQLHKLSRAKEEQERNCDRIEHGGERLKKPV
jgi:hypothetical protein